ncbi:NADPH:quinone reductase-like Zn-dependent oxidoreductase [Nonomuraea polychroma]|uniref:NADPH:quinone reductase-like Zn-dependent oxidoreductase n=1 Tax=Nonomuraea polychroma TaxID=46176 RepID=A0A438MC62_9ACTN|nr:zinc-binding dehydrogenase [Nonomuraea polychroma]RVX43235.1 NADPH:quinone reductase-like Zn-dependent oxidoreductase [Nonomuraea polychroma]
MRVVEVTQFGGPETLQVREAPEPVAGPGQVLIGVSAVDVMSIDAQVRSGWGREWFAHEPPFVPGTGVAGRVLSVGDGVDAGWAGRRVAALVPGGGYAEQVAADTATVVAVPDGLPSWRAAALVQVGPAALSLIGAAQLKPGARVLVTGAGGALGLVLVRLAAAAGARVTAAAHGAAKRAAARDAGADEVIDYADLPDRGFDVVFDGVGGDVGAAAFRLVGPGGRFFAYGVPSGSTAAVDPAEADRRGVRLVGMEQVQLAPDTFRRLAERTMAEAAAGRIGTVVGLAVPLERAREAHAALAARELVGKAILLVTAQAVRYRAHGGPEVLALEEIPMPQPGPGQVRVAVKAAGVNALDWKIRKGLLGTPIDGPQSTGIELAGTIDALGPGVEGRRLGLPVYGQVPSGAAATHAIADADALSAKPDDLSYEEAAALPVAVETAHRTLDALGVRSGHTLLIHAVAGGVGLAAAQLARARGAKVVGTASERHHDFLRGLGVHPVVYGEGLKERLPGPIDRVLDASGRGELELSVELTGDPGKVITIADPVGAGTLGVRFSTGGTTRPAADGVRVPVAEVVPLERAADAHRRSEDGHFLGKIVLTAEAFLPH